MIFRYLVEKKEMPLTTLLAGALLLLTNRVSVQASNCAAAIASVCDDEAETTVCKTIFDVTGYVCTHFLPCSE